MRFSLSIILYFATLSLASPANHFQGKSKWKVGQRVYTSSGPVDGHRAPNATDVSEYLGIPFANPPIGDLRFEPPQHYVGNSVVNGSAFGHSCPQTLPTAAEIQQQYDTAPPGILAKPFLTYSLGQIEAPITLSEDCLTLNIWTKPQVGEKLKAVLLWVYGGGYIQGATQIKYNYGMHLAEETDVVVVTFNYRLGILGFPGSPSGPFNAAFLDQRLAMKWVHSNIAQFGGDPSRITLVGQSAGANMIDYYTYAYPKDPIAAATIQETGNVFSLSLVDQLTVVSAWYTVSSAVGCGDNSTDVKKVWKCMKTIPWSTLLATPPSNTYYTFWPTIDEKYIFSNYTERTLLGHVAKIPLLTGSNDNEAGNFKIPTLLDPSQTLPNSYWKEFALIHTTCPSGQRANASIYNDIPTWRYRWFGAFADLQQTTNPDSGAWHGEEISVIWDTKPITPDIPETSAEKAIGAYTRGAWAAFAKDPVSGLKKFDGWPEWDSAKKTLVRLAYDDKTGKNLALGRVYDAGCVEQGLTMPSS